jgi:hypothetical protein
VLFNVQKAVNELYQVTPFLPKLLDKYPNTRAWIERVKKTPHHDTMLAGWEKITELLKKKRGVVQSKL